MSAATMLDAYIAECARRFPERDWTKSYRRRPDTDVMTFPEPCESCGTRVIAFRMPSGRIKPFHIDSLNGDYSVHMLAHTPDRCLEARAAS